jgi:hypothetical protein
MIKEIISSADSKVRELLNIHTMVLKDFDLDENTIEYKIKYIENKEKTVLNDIKNVLQGGLKNMGGVKYEIIENDTDPSIMKGGGDSDNDTFPYNVFKKVVKLVYDFKNSHSNSLGDKLRREELQKKITEQENLLLDDHKENYENNVKEIKVRIRLSTLLVNNERDSKTNKVL